MLPQEEEEDRQRAEEDAKLGGGRVTVAPVKGGTVDVELGYVPGVKPPAPGEARCSARGQLPSCRRCWCWLPLRTTCCRPCPPGAGEPLTEEQLEFLRERARRTAVHQKQRW